MVAYISDYSMALGEVKLAKNQPAVVPATVEEILAEYSDYGSDIRKILSCVQSPTRWNLTVVWPHLSTFVNGGIALLGDAVGLRCLPCSPHDIADYRLFSGACNVTTYWCGWITRP